jgi:hypothetical protein
MVVLLALSDRSTAKENDKDLFAVAAAVAVTGGGGGRCGCRWGEDWLGMGEGPLSGKEQDERGDMGPEGSEEGEAE